MNEPNEVKHAFNLFIKHRIHGAHQGADNAVGIDHAAQHVTDVFITKYLGENLAFLNLHCRIRHNGNIGCVKLSMRLFNRFRFRAAFVAENQHAGLDHEHDGKHDDNNRLGLGFFLHKNFLPYAIVIQQAKHSKP